MKLHKFEEKNYRVEWQCLEHKDRKVKSTATYLDARVRETRRPDEKSSFIEYPIALASGVVGMAL